MIVPRRSLIVLLLGLAFIVAGVASAQEQPEASPLERLLSPDADDADRMEATVALTRGGEENVSGLIRALEHEHSHTRMFAAWGLGSLRRQALPAAAALTRAMNDEHWRVRLAALEALIAVQPRESLPIAELTDRVNDESAYVRASAILALRSAGPRARSALPALIERLNHPDETEPVRGLIKAALSRIQPSASAEPRD